MTVRRCTNYRGGAGRCERLATGYLHNADGRRIGGGHCETCGRAVVAEYLEKFDWHWSYRASPPEPSALPD